MCKHLTPSIVFAPTSMSAAIKTNRTRKLSVSAPALWLVLGLAAAFFMVRYGQEVLMEHDLNAQVLVQERQNKQMDDENHRLQAALEYYQSDKYIEQRAREDLNLRRPDEEVLIPVGDTVGQTQPDSQQGSATAENNTQQSSPTDNSPNWERWFELFSPFEQP